MPERLPFLFVCYANMDRSPTAEAVCTRIARRPVTREIADLAAKIFVMEPGMAAEIEGEYGQNPAKIICLDILDVYHQNNPTLVQRLEAKIYEYLAHEELI